MNLQKKEDEFEMEKIRSQVRNHARKQAMIPKEQCVACGSCMKVCPRDAITIYHGVYAIVDSELCVGCGICQRSCPATIIQMDFQS